MKASERLIELVNQVKQTNQFKYVDLYFSQDQSESNNIPDFPAALMNVREMIPEDGKVRNKLLKPSFVILLYYDGLNTNTERECQVLDSVEDLTALIANDSRYEVISASCIERSPKQTIWSIEFNYRG